ncbi:MAG: amino acid ABC transporter substrate-binding protein [Actinomycetota bacterium]|nr:amino acid ABC transporter substrate-binding protein [Actinomycetota bacterium]
MPAYRIRRRHRRDHGTRSAVLGARARVFGSLVLALALSAAGCGGGGGGGDGGGSGSETLQIGAALSLTGSLSREGVLTKQGYQLCQNVVNRRGGLQAGDKKYKLKITYQDDTSEPDVAARLVDQFNDKGVKLILGPYGSEATEAASAVVERSGQVMVDSAGADNTIFSKGYQRTFAVLSPATEYAASMVKAVSELASPKPKTVAILTADDGFSKTAAKGGADEAEKQGMKVLATLTFPAHATDVATQLTKARGLHPDLILESGHVEEGIATIKQASELGVKPMGFGETVAPPTPDFTDALGRKAEGVLGSTQWVPQVQGRDKYFGSAKDYVRKFQQQFNSTPEYHNAEASAACLAFALAVEKAGSSDPDAVREALANLDESSFFGPITFDETGKNVTKPMAVVQIQGGKAVTVWPKDAAEADLRWPATR